MIRFILACLIYTLIAHWSYAEIKLLWPQVAPIVESSFNTLQIPTHDRWTRKNIDYYLSALEQDSKRCSAHKASKASQASSSTNSSQEECL